MRLFLLRHGAVQPPRPDTFYGGTEVPLSDLGQEEARRAAQALTAEALDMVLSSPLSRARFGAQCLLQGRSGVSFRELDGMREIARGRWVGLTKEEIELQFPGDRECHRQDPEHWRAHGGESLGDFRDRVMACWKGLERDLLRQERESGQSLQVALVSHLFPTRAILAAYLGLELQEWDSLPIPTASISELTVSAPGKAEVIRIGWKR